MATSPSAAFLRLRAFIAERMRMSPIDQTLMLKELLGRRSPAPRAQRDPPDPGKRMVGPGSPSTASPPMAMATTTGSAATS
jgi:hypothetical protein